MIFNPLHYPALLEQKINALDQAAPLQALQVPEEWKDCVKKTRIASCCTRDGGGPPETAL
jgi:hypothetical protein